MRDKQIKVIYFSFGGSEVKQISLGWKKLFLLSFLSFLVLLALVGVLIGVLTDYYHNAKIVSLNKMNTILKQQLSDMGKKVSRIQSRINELEEKDKDLRIFAKLPKIEKDTWDVGAGGFSIENEYELRFLSKETSDKTIEIQRMLDKLERQMSLALKSHQQIEKKLQQDQYLRDHRPSISPLMEGRITDKFGIRLDPFIKKLKLHEGIDIAADIGTPVYATADGEVEKAEYSYSYNKGYGKEILIDHGDGIYTRYGHLSKILVKQGQKIERWQKIGEVGDTGRATGPHLHYEVIVNGKPQDPMGYIILD